MPYLALENVPSGKMEVTDKSRRACCPNCGSTAWFRDMFNPYWTAPDRAGHYRWFFFMRCSACKKIFHITGNSHVDDGDMPDDMRQWLAMRKIENNLKC